MLQWLNRHVLSLTMFDGKTTIFDVQIVFSLLNNVKHFLMVQSPRLIVISPLLTVTPPCLIDG